MMGSPTNAFDAGVVGKRHQPRGVEGRKQIDAEINQIHGVRGWATGEPGGLGHRAASPAGMEGCPVSTRR